jgi:hypothetical protein
VADTVLSTEIILVEGYELTLTQNSEQRRRAVAWDPTSRDEYQIAWRWTAPADQPGFVIVQPRNWPTREEALAAAQRRLWIERHLRGVAWEASRDEYERACAAAGLTAWTDEAISAERYAMKYANFWMDHYEPSQTVAGDLAQRRYRALQAALPVIAPRTQAAAIAALGIDPIRAGGQVIDGALFKPDASPTTRACARCGTTSQVAWIAGAGEALCVKHQDDY